MYIGDLVQMDPPRLKKLGKTVGVIVDIEEDNSKTVRVCWGEYGTFWTMKKLLKILVPDDEIRESSST